MSKFSKHYCANCEHSWLCDGSSIPEPYLYCAEDNRRCPDDLIYCGAKKILKDFSW